MRSHTIVRRGAAVLGLATMAASSVLLGAALAAPADDGPATHCLDLTVACGAGSGVAVEVDPRVVIVTHVTYLDGDR